MVLGVYGIFCYLLPGKFLIKKGNFVAFEIIHWTCYDLGVLGVFLVFCCLESFFSKRKILNLRDPTLNLLKSVSFGNFLFFVAWKVSSKKRPFLALETLHWTCYNLGVRIFFVFCCLESFLSKKNFLGLRDPTLKLLQPGSLGHFAFSPACKVSYQKHISKP